MAYINSRVLFSNYEVPQALSTSFEASLRNQTMKKESYALTNQFGMNGEPIKNPNGAELKFGGARVKNVDAKACDQGICQVSWKPDRPVATENAKQ